jgi:hypothetical protein
MKTSLIFILLLLSLGCNSYDSTKTDKTSKSLFGTFIKSDTLTTLYPFLDIRKIAIKIIDDSISADITVRQIPDSIIINKYTIGLSHSEYSWTLSFDMKNDSNFTNNIYAELSYFTDSLKYKPNSKIPFQEFLSICNKNLNFIHANGKHVMSLDILDVKQNCLNPL